MTTASSKADEEGFYILHQDDPEWSVNGKVCQGTVYILNSLRPEKSSVLKNPPKDSTGSEHFYGGILALYGTNAQLNKLLL
jgi:hypothetical protein